MSTVSERKEETYRKLNSKCRWKREDLVASGHPCIGDEIDRGRRWSVMVVCSVVTVGCGMGLDEASRQRSNEGEWNEVRRWSVILTGGDW